eukprot:Blabericola_migrator_1__303@NODE_107_length_14077_cov_92_419629_g95_i0_p13_GENE_NODE_107_length_14077_cov_92_419629_g95_i0NODE_107_length_14077_cov_92_419629_g95_i0_p13_ORF_typecomplete_len115_score8_07SsgA/PF04686_12/0_11_NODE_107_length_14077_cov_92_419629_g95_i096440
MLNRLHPRANKNLDLSHLKQTGLSRTTRAEMLSHSTDRSVGLGDVTMAPKVKDILMETRRKVILLKTLRPQRITAHLSQVIPALVLPPQIARRHGSSSSSRFSGAFWLSSLASG